jgi:hypothetical protein
MIYYDLNTGVCGCDGGGGDSSGIYGGNGIVPSNTNATITDKLTFSGGSLKVDDLGGTGDRLVESDLNGDLTAQRTIYQAYITNATMIALLEDTNNWDINGIYTGTSLSGTVQGQKHYDLNYFFEAVADNNFIRLIRG